MSTEFSAALNDLIRFFSGLADCVDLKTGYVPRYRPGVLLPKARVEAVADFLAQDGQVESAAELREEYDRVNEALFPGRLVGVAPPTPQHRQQHLEAAEKRIVAILERVKGNGGDTRGVSLRDAAERIRPNDPEGQAELTKSWRNSRCPKLPKPIGKCPHHRQTNLYEPAAIVRFLKEVEGREVDREVRLSAHFRKVSRLPSPAE